MGSMAERTERSRLAAEATLNALRKRDDGCVQIAASAAHVAMYALRDGAWTKMDLEGPLHLVVRNSDPHLRMFVLNRKGIEDLVEDLRGGHVQLEKAKAMIMYKLDQQPIKGIWFYDEAECDAVLVALQKTLSLPAGSVPETGKSASMQPHHHAQMQPQLPHQVYQAQHAYTNTSSPGAAHAGAAPVSSLERFFPGLGQSQSPVMGSPARTHVMAHSAGAAPALSPAAPQHEQHQLQNGTDTGGQYLLGLLQSSPMAGSNTSSIQYGTSQQPHPTQSLVKRESEIAELLGGKRDAPYRAPKMSVSELRAVMQRLLSDQHAFDAMYHEYMKL
ncbi:mRNA-decapping enzyme-like protein [Porphyridium purpureum]|uniref:mRNA-decapping enzyme-like protein n=1 Tax=Porphyridium purpureum TaxID=35688 RepID=A0A5J4YTM3_PORPP|nr:mRNA-decapping enzyme-like protein [Porphyridium purpureum]|eukprot:POR8943..scf227_4